MIETTAKTPRRAVRDTDRARMAHQLAAVEWTARVAVLSWGAVLLITLGLGVWWLVAQ